MQDRRTPTTQSQLTILLSAAALTAVAVGCAEGQIGEPGAPTPEFYSAPTPVGDMPDPNGVHKDLCDDMPNKVPASVANKIYYGTRQPTLLPLDEEQIMAVVAIGFGTTSGSSCSGTLISDRVVLTARHCTEGRQGSFFYALFGENDRSPVLAVRAVRKREHPQIDLALLELESAPADQIQVRPIPIPHTALTGSETNLSFEASGFGQTETGGQNGRFFVTERFQGFTNNNNNLAFNGQGQRGVCYGDSGGPTMRITEDGDVRVYGAVSGGDGTCVGYDHYGRVDIARSWVEEWTGPTPFGEAGGGCGELSGEGRCVDGDATAEWCEGGQLQQQSCSGSQVCGWSDSDTGWRCMPPESDPCDGLGYQGRCDGDVLEYCEGGEYRARPCGTCGERCVLVNESFGHACVSNDSLVDDDQDTIPDEFDLCSNTRLGERVWTHGGWMGCAAGQRRDLPGLDPVFDADLDGIGNDIDLCSQTPRDMPVWTEGEWIGCAAGQRRDGTLQQGNDGDSDGIVDSLDLCSGTPAGAPVWTAGEWIGCANGQRRDR